jgi:Protein of unknown function with HXXEE motif
MNRQSAISLRQSRLFLALIVAQACHSVEEYAFRLFDVFPPARWLVSLFSDDPARGFIIFNIAFVAFGLWCYLFPVRRGWPSAIPLLWMWALIETVNGIVHPAFSIVVRGYTPGLVTSLALLPLGVLLIRRLRRINSQLPTR